MSHADEEKEIEATKAPLMDHLIELRSRLIKAAAAFIIAMICCFFFAKLSIGCCQCQIRTPESRHVDFERVVQRATVIMLAISVEERTKPIPSGMMWVEPPGPYRQSTTAFPVAGIGNQKTQVRRGESVHRVERDGAVRGDPKRLELAPKELRRG